jgi:hypothetical protein
MDSGFPPARRIVIRGRVTETGFCIFRTGRAGVLAGSPVQNSVSSRINPISTSTYAVFVSHLSYRKNAPARTPNAVFHFTTIFISTPKVLYPKAHSRVAFLQSYHGKMKKVPSQPSECMLTSLVCVKSGPLAQLAEQLTLNQ